MRDIPLTAMLYLSDAHLLRCYSPHCQHGDGSDQADVIDLPRRFRLGDVVDAINDHLERYEREPVTDLPDLSEPVG